MAQTKKPADKAKVAKTPAKPNAKVTAPPKAAPQKSPDAKSVMAKAVAGNDAKKVSASSTSAKSTIKKPVPATKPVPSPVAAKPAPTKVEMSKTAVKTSAPVKAAAPKPALAQAPKAVQPVVHKPAVAAAPKAPLAPAKALAPALNGTRPAMPVAKAPIVGAPRPVQTAAALATAAAAASAAQAAGPKKPVNVRHGFKTNEWIVYPSHGVGRIVAIEEQEIAGMTLELFVITFEKDKMTLRVPTGKSQSVGMRKLAEDGVVKRAMETLKGRARIKRTMWSRRAQEFDAKINSGDLVAIAEVVRDLFRADNQPEQSYSERQLYEAALDRMAREIAAVEKIDERGAVQRITEVLSKSAKSRRAAAGEGGPAEVDVADAGEEGADVKAA